MTINDIQRIVKIPKYGVYILNGSEILTPPDLRFDVLEEYIVENNDGKYPETPTEEEIALAQPTVDRIIAKFVVKLWRAAGQDILDEVAVLLAQKAPTPAEGLANLTALETVDKLLSRGDLRVAKGALEAADLTGTSFEGDSDSYDYVMGLLDAKIAELTA